MFTKPKNQKTKLDIALDPRFYAPSPVKALTREEIEALYPGVPVVRKIETRSEAWNRIRKNHRNRKKQNACTIFKNNS